MSKSLKICSLAIMIVLTLPLLLPVMCRADETGKNDIPVTCSSGEALQSFLNGREAFEMGRLNDAKALFEIAVQKDPQFASAYLYIAYAASSDTEWKQNIDLALFNRNHVSEGEKILIDMESALSDRNSQRRFELAKQLVELYPSSTRAQLVLAKEYQVRKEYTKSRDMATNAILLDPNSPLGYRTLASSYLFNEPLDFTLAQKYMEKFVDLRPNEATAFIALGDVHRAYMNLDRAIIFYTKAIKLDSASDVAYSKRGFANAYQGFFDDARHDWEMSLKLANNNSKISWPNYSVLSYLVLENGKSTIDVIPGSAENTGKQNAGKKGKHQLEGTESDHYFCCTVISMKHGLYVSPFRNINECSALQREFIQESKAPDARMTAANIAFIKAIHAVLQNDFKMASLKAEEYARLSEPGLKPVKMQVYNYMMGLINLKQEHWGMAVDYFLKSDLTNACVKYELGLAYDGLGEWEKAQEMFNDVSNCNFTSLSKPQMIKISHNWLNAYADISEE